MTAVRLVAAYSAGDEREARQPKKRVLTAKPQSAEVNLAALFKSVRNRTKKARAILAR
jgi:hypothetical protein